MKKEIRTIVYDEELNIEAYCLEGIVQPFPNHFHDFFVVGIMEGGERYLCCKNREYILKQGDIVLFNPGDTHACAQNGEEALNYRAFNIPKNMMLAIAKEATQKEELPGFSQNVVYDDEAGSYLRALHRMVMSGYREFEKEENLILLISLLIQRYGQPFECCLPECRSEIENACRYMEERFQRHVCLEDICSHVGLSKSTLLRAFTRSKGVTPYRYLETIRIGEAKKLLEKGIAPIEVAMQTGFSDQSHFTNYFTSFIGLSPGVYREIFNAKPEKNEEIEHGGNQSEE